MTLDPVRWNRIQAVFHAATRLSPLDRRAYLERECAGDSGLLAEVEALLEEDARTGSLLDRGVARAAHQVLDGGGRGLPPEREIGRYRIQGVLGEGGMGVVYLAERTDLGGKVALKILRDASLSPARRERFANEQRTLAQLSHPAIAPLYDADTLPDGTPWFAMEYVDGAPLTDYCRSRGLTVPDRLRLFRLVCEAVQHAHSHAVIHRDLKPSNILVRPDGGVKLLDFGIAKHLETLDLPADQTRTGLRLLTPAYAAPEQIKGGRVGIHTDIYSLGVVLYQLLAGRLPFDFGGKGPAEIETILSERQPERASAAGGAGATRRAWADLDVLCLTAMHKEPERRYRTVEALIRDLDHYLEGEPLEARPDTVGYRVGKFVRRNWRPVSAAAAGVVLVIGLTGFYTVRLASARNAALNEAATNQRIQRFMLNLFQGGDEAAGPSDSLRVITLVDRGVQEARVLDVEPAVQAELFITLGTMFQRLGNFARADTLLDAALAQRRELFGPEHEEVAEALLALGQLRIDQAQFEEADSLIRDGLAMTRRNLSPAHPAVASATTILGRVLEERGQYDEAIRVLETAVRLHAAAGPGSAELAESMTELANTHFYAGHYPVSDSLNRIVLGMDRQLYGERHPKVAEDLINLGANQFEWGKYQEAERYYRQAVGITEAWYGPQHHRTASAITMLGRSLVYQSRHDEAGALLQRSLAIQERVFGPVHPRVASALNDLGNIAIAQKRFDDAERNFTRMISTYRAIYGEKHYLLGIATSNLASVYTERKDYGGAERLFRQAVALYSETQGPEHTNTAIGRIKLGRSLLRQRRFEEAARESQAGYDILIKQTDPGVSFIRAARTDLAAAYDTLGQREKAARFRAELSDTGKKGN